MTPGEHTIYNPQQVIEISRRPGLLGRTLKPGDRISARADRRRDMTELLREHAVPYYVTCSAGTPGEVFFEIADPDPREYRVSVSINAY
jgi:hypothetical protein